MQTFVDREKAIKDINTLLAEQSTPWIVLSGSSKIGKTEFAKKIAGMNKRSVYCDPKFGILYASTFVQSIQFENGTGLENLIYEFSLQDSTAQSIYKTLGQPYVTPLKKIQLESVLKLLIKNDITNGIYSFAHYLGSVLSSETKCIFLDDFHRCDFDSYCWILEFWNSLYEPHPTVIAICNFELIWESSKLLNIFHSVVSPINIEKFDCETAFYDIMKEYFTFVNDVNLASIAKQLYSLYEGSSQLLFETIKLLKGKMSLSNDLEKKEQIFKIANQIRLYNFYELNKMHILVLRLLAYCPTPITKKCIIDILDLIDPIATEIINKLYESNFVDHTAHKKTGKTMYYISDKFLIDIIQGGCSSTEQLFFKTKIYRAVKNRKINATLEQALNFAMDIGEDEAEEILLQYIAKSKDKITSEKKAFYIDKLLNTLPIIPETLTSIEIVKLLYLYGYYQSAEKLITCIFSTNKILDFDDLLLLGDIQHVLLSPNASQTYRRASEISEISISDKLKALNRQIMALNQEHQEDLAKKIYIDTFAQYEATPCVGLVELYRNSNNSFGYAEAMQYTIKGFTLAKELNEELEMYKCLHNICMIRLQYGYYGQPLEDNALGFEPKFEYALAFFSKHPEFRHEQAYPLLDLGTVKMFEYVGTEDRRCLIAAKKNYSEAQLYAKSFYARHIAETGLLIVNSYLYADKQSTFIKNSRNNLYNRYLQQKDTIQDYRVHRKILLSLALSAIISEEMQEAMTYLAQANPYIIGAETLRYNRLCFRAGCPMYKKPPVSLQGKYEVYYGSDKFVPWLISLCH